MAGGNNDNNENANENANARTKATANANYRTWRKQEANYAQARANEGERLLKHRVLYGPRSGPYEDPYIVKLREKYLAEIEQQRAQQLEQKAQQLAKKRKTKLNGMSGWRGKLYAWRRGLTQNEGLPRTGGKSTRKTKTTTMKKQHKKTYKK